MTRAPKLAATALVLSVEPVSTTTISSTRWAAELRQAGRFSSSSLTIMHSETFSLLAMGIALPLPTGVFEDHGPFRALPTGALPPLRPTAKTGQRAMLVAGPSGPSALHPVVCRPGGSRCALRVNDSTNTTPEARSIRPASTTRQELVYSGALPNAHPQGILRPCATADPWATMKMPESNTARRAPPWRQTPDTRVAPTPSSNQGSVAATHQPVRGPTN